MKRTKLRTFYGAEDVALFVGEAADTPRLVFKWRLPALVYVAHVT